VGWGSLYFKFCNYLNSSKIIVVWAACTELFIENIRPFHLKGDYGQANGSLILVLINKNII
jgi:hypothetical protein